MNDKLIMENYLLVLKSTTEVFVHGTLESSFMDTRNILKKGLDTITNSQANTFKKMEENNFYQVNKINSNVIANTLSKIKSNN